MKMIVIGKTDAVISLNKIGVPIRGKEKAVLNIENQEQQNEINGLINMGLVEEVIDFVSPLAQPIEERKIEKEPTTEKLEKPVESIKTVENKIEPKKRGRPKKNTPKEITKEVKDQQRIYNAEAETQKMGAKVIIVAADGQPVETRMRHSAVNDMAESEKTAASIRAMEKLEKEEKEDLERIIREEAQLDPSEQMGGEALISTENGEEKVKLVNSILPESNKKNKVDPFIDRNDQKPDIKFIEESPLDDNSDNSDNPDDFDDAFIKI